MGLNQEDILEAVIEKVMVMDPKTRINTDANRKMILNLIATAVQSETKIEGAFEKFISTEVLDELLQGEGDKALELGFKKNFNLNENLNLINNIVARNDLSQESRIKQIVSIFHSGFCYIFY